MVWTKVLTIAEKKAVDNRGRERDREKRRRKWRRGEERVKQLQVGG
jgi:hypothetical protein